ncbi:MAG: tRNA-dihydrouridine synthase family protein [Eubacteriales bacterium]|nr:tRNA-dihydrouridine synthase family protein [Eubacteriales bacterium]
MEKMKKKEKKCSVYAAPMEGVTGYIYRNAHWRHFKGIDKYFTPFLTPKQGKGWTSREKNDVAAEHNKGVPVVPQILTNHAGDFVRMASLLQDCGYEEVNLNLGCPSGTVVSKGKGCGFLRDKEKLLYFFDEIFQKVDVKVSVKTRLGMEDPGEIEELVKIYNRFPLSEVIVHARVRGDFYKKPVNWDAFEKGFLLTDHCMCYNGDIYAKSDLQRFQDRFPQIDTVMIGRGLIANPQLAETLAGEEARDLKRWRAFHDEVCLGYEEIMSGERNVLFKMKELWSYMLPMFPGAERWGKKIKKAVCLKDYQEAVNEVFERG